MTNILELPSYLEQDEAVKDRFTRLKQRPVALEVKGLGKLGGIAGREFRISSRCGVFPTENHSQKQHEKESKSG